MKGNASILSLRFRIYGDAFLPQLEANSAALDARCRLHAPFRVRPGGSPLSPIVPFAHWPNFEWNPKVPDRSRLKPPEGLTPQPLGQRAYDAIRIDTWSLSAEGAAQEAIPRMMRWWRYLTFQPWIGAFEPQTDTMFQSSFVIDHAGRALETPYTHATFISPSLWMKTLTKDLWADGFKRGIELEEPPLYWMLWLDSENYIATGNSHEAVLALALSLETARGAIFPKFASARNHPVLGPLLRAPFDDTDLLDHLDTDLQQVLGRSLRHELPDCWSAISDLYVARHHIAHGKLPIVRRESSVRPLTPADVGAWSEPVRETLLWLEALPAGV